MDGTLKANTGPGTGVNSGGILNNIWEVVTSFFINLMMSLTILHHDEIPDLETGDSSGFKSETADSSSFNSETADSSDSADNHDFDSETADSSGFKSNTDLLPCTLKVVAADPHNTKTAESSGFISNSGLLPRTLKVALAVRSFLFEQLCLIIPYDEPYLGNIGSKKKLLSQVVLSCCYACAVALPFLPEETRLKNRLLINVLRFTLGLAFGNVLVANMISDKSPVTAHAFLVIGILCGVTAFFMTLSIPLSLSFTCAIWFVFAATIIVVIVVRLK